MAFESEAFETLYGGAAGGGKSDLLLGLAMREHQSAILFRRTYPELEDSLILRSRELYFGKGKYNESKHVWQMNDKRRIRFAHLEREESVKNYQGAGFDLIAFDELTQFTKLQYEYMISRARTTRKKQRVRIAAATNPGGEGNDWVMERWAPWLDELHPNPAKPGELRYFKRNPDGREVETTADDPEGLSRTFIPARLADNPYLGRDYEYRLNLLPEPYRSQLKEGNWKVGMTDDAFQVIPRAWVKAAQARWTASGRGDRPLACQGVDVARGGDDKTVIANRYGNWMAELEKWPGALTPDGQTVIALISPTLKQYPKAWANIDVIGVGASVYDTGRQQGLRVSAVNFAEGSSMRDRTGVLEFVNVRAEAWWSMREALDPVKGDSMALPPDPELLADLCAPRWMMRKNGVQIEAKDDIKARIGRSPDCGDAVVLANFRSWQGQVKIENL
jgi:hypothetical protein